MQKFICPNCEYLLNIIKSPTTTKIIKISTPTEFINAIKLDEVVEYDIQLEKSDLETYLTKKNTKTTEKNHILNTYDTMKSQKQITTKYNIKCTSCAENYILHPETIIYSLNIGKQQSSFDDDNIDLKLFDQTLPRTKDYICVNVECETNKKNFNNSKKEAIFYRASKSYHMKYACLNCKTSWNI
jgi:hypothetical protein